MKVILGWMNEEHGTVETSPSGGPLLYAGPDPEHVRDLVARRRTWYDRAGVLHALGDEELVRSLPYRLQGPFTWAVFVDAQGLTQEQPAYDPWGDLWRPGVHEG